MRTCRSNSPLARRHRVWPLRCAGVAATLTLAATSCGGASAASNTASTIAFVQNELTFKLVLPPHLPRGYSFLLGAVSGKGRAAAATITYNTPHGSVELTETAVTATPVEAGNRPTGTLRVAGLTWIQYGKDNIERAFSGVQVELVGDTFSDVRAIARALPLS